MMIPDEYFFHETVGETIGYRLPCDSFMGYKIGFDEKRLH
jgi:hypothetical protein